MLQINEEALPLLEAFPYLGQKIAYNKQKLGGGVLYTEEGAEVVGNDSEGSGNDRRNVACPGDDV